MHEQKTDTVKRGSLYQKIIKTYLDTESTEMTGRMAFLWWMTRAELADMYVS